MNLLKIAAYCAYLASWLTFAIAAVAGALPKLGKPPHDGFKIEMPALIGTLLQGFAALATTRLMPAGPLHPAPWESIGTLLLAPFGCAMFVWALRSSPRQPGQLATGGAYAWLRHPIYLAFLALLLATGFLLSARFRLVLPVMLYVSGSELRIFCEERELAVRFREEFARYRRKTRWMYLPGLR
jgi:protein-S-isoprenylcysteine O-methyltransferase Ste14